MSGVVHNEGHLRFINLHGVIIAGNLTRDPERRCLQSGMPVRQVSMAGHHRVKKGEQWVDDPGDVCVVISGKSAGYLGQNADTGQPVVVRGRLPFRTSSGQDGQKRSKHEVVARSGKIFGDTRSCQPVLTIRRAMTRMIGGCRYLVQNHRISAGDLPPE